MAGSKRLIPWEGHLAAPGVHRTRQQRTASDISTRHSKDRRVRPIVNCASLQSPRISLRSRSPKSRQVGVHHDDQRRHQGMEDERVGGPIAENDPGVREQLELSRQNAIGSRRIASLNTYDVERYFRHLKSAGAGRSTVRPGAPEPSLQAGPQVERWELFRIQSQKPNFPPWTMSERPDEVRSPELAEVQALLSASTRHDERFGVFVRLVAATGMRRGEACAFDGPTSTLTGRQ